LIARGRIWSAYIDGIDPQAGTLVGGLFFIAFMKNPMVHQAAELAGNRRSQRVHPSRGQRGIHLPTRPVPRPALGDGLLTA